MSPGSAIVRTNDYRLVGGKPSLSEATEATENPEAEVVSGVSPTADLVFASSWSTATGSGDAAQRDTGRARPWQSTAAGSLNGNGIVQASGGLFPSSQHMNLDGFTGQMYMVGFGTLYTPVEISVGDYFMMRYLIISTNRTLGTGLAVNPGGTVGDYDATTIVYFAGVTLQVGQLYELMVTYDRPAGLTFNTRVRVYELDGSFNRTLLAQTADYVDIGGTGNTLEEDNPFAGSQDNAECIRDVNFGMGEDPNAIGDNVHPIWVGNWPESGSYNADSLGSFLMDMGGTPTSGFARVGCFALWYGDIANRIWPAPQWSQAEEDWSP